MAVCLKTHSSYEVIVSGWDNPESFAMQITSYRPDGSKVDVYNYTATWGSEYYYSQWLRLAGNFSPEFSDVQREPGRMDILNQFLRAPGVITTLRTAYQNFPCPSPLTIETDAWGELTLEWTGDRAGFYVQIGSPVAPPDDTTFWGQVTLTTSPQIFGRIYPVTTVQGQMVDPDTLQRVALSNSVTTSDYSIGPVTVIVVSPDAFVATWGNTLDGFAVDIQLKVEPDDDWIDLGGQGPIGNGVPFAWSSLDVYWRIQIFSVIPGVQSDFSNTFFM